MLRLKKSNALLWLYPIFALSFSIYVLTHSLACSFYTKKALDICFTTLVPSLFPFVFAAAFLSCVMPEITKENRILNTLSRLFGVPPTLIAGVLLGLFSGFPSGAVFVTKIFRRGLCTKEEAVRAVCLSNNCSASFLINIAGVSVFKSAEYGGILLVCQILSVVTASQILKSVRRNECHKVFPATKEKKQDRVSFSKAFTDSIKSSCLSMLYISGFVTFFFTLSSLLCDSLFTSSDIFRVISGATFEISTGTIACANLRFPLSFVLCAFCICFPSLSVLFQIKSICDECFDVTKQYVFTRLCMSLLSASFACMILRYGILKCAVFCMFFSAFCVCIPTLRKTLKRHRVKNVQK